MFAAITRPSSLAFGVLTLGAWGLLAGAGQGASAVSPSLPREVIPQTLGMWTGAPVQMDRRVFEILETRDVTVTEYRMGQEPPVWLAQVEGFGKRAAFHPPELCYVGSHFEVVERGPLSVIVNGRQKQVMRLVVSQGQERFEAWYWFTANGRVTPSYYQQQWWLLLDAVHRKPMVGSLVRISTPLDEPHDSHRRLLAFVTSLDAASGQGGSRSQASQGSHQDEAGRS
ncbi:MAG: EpsI family protein [Candidatus Omnitrophica bacterium]|nr:EpsI family protein [Candidatus Omnitrophota bacterium]